MKFLRESALKSTTARLRKLLRINQYAAICDRRFEQLWRRNCSENFCQGVL